MRVPEGFVRWFLSEPWRPLAYLAVYSSVGVTVCLLHLLGAPLPW